MRETLDIVIQGGALGLLALVLCGFIYVAAAVVPSIKGFFERLTASLGSIETKVHVLEVKVDGVVSSLGKVPDAVSAEGFETRTELGQAERRITAAVRREQASDPPPAPAAPGRLSAAPRPARVGG